MHSIDLIIYDYSVRVSNELGAGNPKVAKFSVLVVNATSILMSLFFGTIVLVFKVGLSKLFSTDSEVVEAVKDLAPLLALSVLLNGIQPILSGKLIKHDVASYHYICSKRPTGMGWCLSSIAIQRRHISEFGV